jgi:hypothetical protein
LRSHHLRTFVDRFSQIGSSRMLGDVPFNPRCKAVGIVLEPMIR